MSKQTPSRAKSDPPAETPAAGKKKPNRIGRAITFWLDPRIAADLDRFVEAQRLKPKLTDIMELALQEFLAKEGFSSHDRG